ncbi:hypothetical protein [Natronosalvus vescus]|uniref:hypothetical protein n=1 Tax=Natronosalvus vescus TaxID=2953881 RepID=UPI0020918218|nr:hypothetical protein [Natronosalvus vescus]
MSRPTRGVLYTSPPSPHDTHVVRNPPPAIAATLEREAATEADEAESTTEPERSPEADPQLTAATTSSSLTGTPADD